MTLSPAQRNDFDFVSAFLKGKIGAEMQRYVQFSFNDNFAVIAASRQMEADADTGGVRMVSAAGYDPQGLVRAFDRMNTRVDGDTRYYNHPALGARIASIRTQIVREGLKGNDRGRDRLSAIVAKLKAAAGNAPAPANAYLALPAHAAGAGCLLEDAQQFWAVPLKPAKH
jgi:predicted Zn-dependent protease